MVLTGAGISVPSGIPDFRTPMTGLWANVDPMEVAHISVWRRDPARFWSFYGQRFAILDGKQPNGAHRALAELERRGLLAGVITQNIDGLHAARGTRDPIEVHGSIRTASCLECGASYSLAETRGAGADADGVPRCDCGAVAEARRRAVRRVAPGARRSCARTRAGRDRGPDARDRLVAGGLPGGRPAGGDAGGGRPAGAGDDGPDAVRRAWRR